MDDILSLQAQVKQMEKMVKKGKRKQKESKELQRKMIREWEEMKAQFQDMINTEENKHQLSKRIGIRVHVFKRAFCLNSKYYRSAFRLR